MSIRKVVFAIGLIAATQLPGSQSTVDLNEKGLSPEPMPLTPGNGLSIGLTLEEAEKVCGEPGRSLATVDQLRYFWSLNPDLVTANHWVLTEKGEIVVLDISDDSVHNPEPGETAVYRCTGNFLELRGSEES